MHVSKNGNNQIIPDMETSSMFPNQETIIVSPELETLTMFPEQETNKCLQNWRHTTLFPKQGTSTDLQQGCFLIRLFWLAVFNDLHLYIAIYNDKMTLWYFCLMNDRIISQSAYVVICCRLKIWEFEIFFDEKNVCKLKNMKLFHLIFV